MLKQAATETPLVIVGGIHSEELSYIQNFSTLLVNGKTTGKGDTSSFRFPGSFGPGNIFVLFLNPS